MGAHTEIREKLAEVCELADQSQIPPTEVVSMLVNTIIGRTEAGKNCSRSHVDEIDPADLEPPF
jgi:hypothetical protein